MASGEAYRWKALEGLDLRSLLFQDLLLLLQLLPESREICYSQRWFSWHIRLVHLLVRSNNRYITTYAMLY